MSSSQGLFESNEDYEARVSREADETTIEKNTGSKPSQGFFESDSDYRSRIWEEAKQSNVESSTGNRPGRGFFENDDDYRSRLSTEDKEATISRLTGHAPSQGFFESNDAYQRRLTEEARSAIIEKSSGSAPSQGLFESDRDYRHRIRREANEALASRSVGSASYADDDEPAGSASTGTSGGCSVTTIGLVLLAAVFIIPFLSSPKGRVRDKAGPQTVQNQTHQPRPALNESDHDGPAGHTPWFRKNESQNPPPAQPSPALPEYRVIHISNDDYLNVREGPGTAFRLVGALPNTFSPVYLAGEGQANEEDIWFPIQTPDLSGWVNAAYLQESGTTRAEPTWHVMVSACNDFYSTRGEWAGQFKITRIRSLNISHAGPQKRSVLLAYEYRPLPLNALSSGWDRRRFELVQDANGFWQATSMSGSLKKWNE